MIIEVEFLLIKNSVLQLFSLICLTTELEAWLLQSSP